jgi:hypothetical protein
MSHPGHLIEGAKMDTPQNTQRRQQLMQVAETYFDALRRRDFAAIPYADNIRLRAPLAPGGVNQPLVGKQALRSQWWQPLESALTGVQIHILDHYLNEGLTAIVTEAEITFAVANPPVTLRIADRFTVDEGGNIVEQENHFDPRDLTNPGWQTVK